MFFSPDAAFADKRICALCVRELKGFDMIALGKVVILMFNIYLVLLPGAGDVVFCLYI